MVLAFAGDSTMTRLRSGTDELALAVDLNSGDACRFRYPMADGLNQHDAIAGLALDAAGKLELQQNREDRWC